MTKNKLDNYNININFNINLKLLKKIIKIFILTVLVCSISTLTYSPWKPEITLISLSLITSIFTLKFFPLTRRYYMLIPILLNLLIALITIKFNRIDGVHLVMKIFRTRFYIIIANMVILTIISKIYLKKECLNYEKD